MVEVRARRREGFTHDVEIDGEARLVIDEPRESGGADKGPSPTRTLAGALAACTAITVEMYADRKGWEVGDVKVDVDYELESQEGWARFDLTIYLPKALSDEQVEKIIVIAGRCPIHRVLLGEIEIAERVERV